MYKTSKYTPTSIHLDNCYEAETIEQKIERIVNNKEPITDGAPLIYTERKAGIQKAYNIRTDRWEIATEAMDKVTSSRLAKREERHQEPAKVIDIKKDETSVNTSDNQ